MNGENMSLIWKIIPDPSKLNGENMSLILKIIPDPFKFACFTAWFYYTSVPIASWNALFNLIAHAGLNANHLIAKPVCECMRTGEPCLVKNICHVFSKGKRIKLQFSMPLFFHVPLFHVKSQSQQSQSTAVHRLSWVVQIQVTTFKSNQSNRYTAASESHTCKTKQDLEQKESSAKYALEIPCRKMRKVVKRSNPTMPIRSSAVISEMDWSSNQ